MPGPGLPAAPTAASTIAATTTEAATTEAEGIREAVLADRIETVQAWLARGGDPDLPLDGAGATPLFYACTPAMLTTLLARGADPARVLADGRSTLDAAAHEGQTAMLRLLLRAAPDLATEERALLAADHPESEALIRRVARGDTVDSTDTAHQAPAVTLLREPDCREPGTPPEKGASRYHGTPLPGERTAAPGWAAGRVGAGTTVFDGPGGSVLVFGEEAPRVLRPDGETTLPVPPVPWPYEHAFDAEGRHFFFGYGQRRVLGVDAGTGESMVDLELPGAGWGTALITLDGEDRHGHGYPARIAVVDGWLFAVSLERIHIVGFGARAAAPAQWYTCQFGTCVTPVREGRLVLVGARAGGAVFGLDGDRVQRLADLSAPRDEGTSPRHGQLRMVLRVSGQGHDDPRSLHVTDLGDRTIVEARGVGDHRGVTVAGLRLDPAELEESWPTDPEIVDAFEWDGVVRLRVCPVGLATPRGYRIEGLDELWHRAFRAAATEPPPGDALVAVPVALPAEYDPPHADIGTLSYPEVGATGYAHGFRVSPRPGFWNSFVVDAAGVRPLEPPWFSGVTFRAFHDTQPRLVLGAGREVVEVDLTTRRWRSREFDAAVRGVSFFGSGLAVALADELVLLPAIDAEPERRVPTTTREAELASFLDHQVLCVAGAGRRNVLLGRRDVDGAGAELVVLGVLDAAVTGQNLSADGDFLHTTDGALRLFHLREALATAPKYSGGRLDDLDGPDVTVLS